MEWKPSAGAPSFAAELAAPEIDRMATQILTSYLRSQRAETDSIAELYRAICTELSRCHIADRG